MKIKEFFKNTKKTLGIKSSDKEDNSKKKRLKDLLSKLETNVTHIKNDLKNKELDSEKKAALEEELHIYKLQIKKGQTILDQKS